MVWVILISLMRIDWCGYSLILSPFAGLRESTEQHVSFALGRLSSIPLDNEKKKDSAHQTKDVYVYMVAERAFVLS